MAVAGELRRLTLQGTGQRQPPAPNKYFFADRLVQNFDVVQIHFQRETLLGRGKDEDDLALMAEFRNDPLHSREDAS